MASARKDKKGRALYKGENEHAAGGYYYQYMHHGKRRTVYAPSLPELREKEDQIKKAMMDGLDSHLAKTKTLNDMFDEYMRLKTDIREQLVLIIPTCIIISSGTVLGNEK